MAGTCTNEKKPRVYDNSERKCFNCKKMGHSSRDCNETKRVMKCYNC